MRKSVGLLSVALLLGFSQNAAAQFVDGSTGLHNVATVKRMRNDSQFTMEGNILRRVGPDRYVFRDRSGELQVEIEHKKWRGLRVDPDTRVRISGKVERGWFGAMEVEVKRLELAYVDMNQ